MHQTYTENHRRNGTGGSLADRIKAVAGVVRLPFLALTPACVLLGYGAAVWSGANAGVLNLVIAMAGALGAHSSVNAINEYLDFKSGLDMATRRTPFSGGSGALPGAPHAAGLALGVGVASLIVTLLVGAYFVYLRGLWLVPAGVVGVFLVVAYTPYLVRRPLACLAAPGLGFGPAMVMGTSFVLTGAYSATALFASLVPMFQVSGLLLLNQFPDVEADRAFGRKNLPIVIGRRASAVVFATLHALAYASIISGVAFGYLPGISLVATATVVLALPSAIGALVYSDNIKKITPYMALNVGATIATPLVLAVSLLAA